MSIRYVIGCICKMLKVKFKEKSNYYLYIYSNFPLFALSDIPEPVYSTLQGIGEILTNFVSNNLWDRLFRLTLISSTAQTGTVEQFLEHYRQSPKNVSWSNISQ